MVSIDTITQQPCFTEKQESHAYKAVQGKSTQNQQNIAESRSIFVMVKRFHGPPNMVAVREKKRHRQSSKHRSLGCT